MNQISTDLFWILLTYSANPFSTAQSLPHPNFKLIPSELGIDHFDEIWKQTRAYSLLDIHRTHQIWKLMHEVETQPGDIIECGSHRGGLSFFIALYIQEKKINKKVFLCDSFQGLPKPSDKDSFFTEGMFNANLEQCKQLRTHFNLDSIIEIVPGWFEETLPKLTKNKNQKFCLVHLDADLYESTETILEYIYPKAINNTPFIVDDYLIPSSGVRLACWKQLDQTKETLEQGPCSQAYFRKGKTYDTPFTHKDPEGNLLSFKDLRMNSFYQKHLKRVLSDIENHRQTLISFYKAINDLPLEN
ncbi:MAG: class I SAM-dependent methyltransferase [Deltaproteobacteria bacterium]|nr:class I SAM-dependent methyltransferase [Deltaproteobacteria bacterium]